MANVVLIAAGTKREGINDIGDVVDTYDDDVELGSAYGTFDILHVIASDSVITAAELKMRLEALVDPEKTSKYGRNIKLNNPTRDNLVQGRWTKEQILGFLDTVEVKV